jgi:hypothetical protein
MCDSDMRTGIPALVGYIKNTTHAKEKARQNVLYMVLREYDI